MARGTAVPQVTDEQVIGEQILQAPKTVRRKKSKQGRTATVTAASAAAPFTGGAQRQMTGSAWLKNYAQGMHTAGYTETQILEQAAQGIRSFLRGAT